jgi:hypothetical protein
MRVDVRCEPYGENVSKSRWGKAIALLGDQSTRLPNARGIRQRRRQARRSMKKPGELIEAKR